MLSRAAHLSVVASRTEVYSENCSPLCSLLQTDLKEIDEALHRSLAVSLPSMHENEMRDALAGITFSVPSRTQQAVTTARASSMVPHAGASPNDVDETSSQEVCSFVNIMCFGSEEGFESPLRPGGAQQAVTPGGFEEYRDLVVRKRLVSDCSAQMELIRTGAWSHQLVQT